MEFKRALLNKRTILIFIMLIALGTGFYINTQYHSSDLYGASLQDVNKERNILLTEAKSKPLTDAEKYLENLSENTDAFTPKGAVISEVLKQIKHINSYKGYLESIDKKSEQMSSISIFAESNTFSSNNITRTIEEYKHLKTLVLSLDIDEPITFAINYDLVNYLVFVFGIVVILSFVEERKKGLWNVIYSTSNGRLKLTLRRLGTLSLSVAFATIIMNVIVFVSSFTIYGTGDLSRNIQSIEMFRNFTIPMTVWQFIVFYIAVKVLVQLALSYLVWAIITLIHNTNLAVVFLGVVFTIEYILYSLLPTQSVFALLKYVNAFAFLNPNELIITYSNIDFFTIPMNRFILLVVSALILSIIFIGVCIFSGCKTRPQKELNTVEVFFIRIFSKINRLYWMLIERLTPTGIELYKILIMQKGAVVILALTAVLLSQYNSNPIYYSGTDSIVNSFYDSYGGEVTSDTIEYINTMKYEIEQIGKDYSNAIEEYNKGNLSENEYITATLRFDAFDDKRQAYDIIKQRTDYAIKNKVSLVNPTGYENLLGEQGFEKQQILALLSVFALIIMLSALFGFEKKCLMQSSLRSTSTGRQMLFRKKTLSVCILTTAIWLICNSFEIAEICNRFGLSQLQASVKSLEFMCNIPVDMSIIVFVMLLYLARLLVLLSVSSIIGLISHIGNLEKALALSTAILILPKVLSIFGITIFENIAVQNSISIMNLLLNSQGCIFILATALVIFLGVASIVISKNIWCKGGRL